VWNSGGATMVDGRRGAAPVGGSGQAHRLDKKRRRRAGRVGVLSCVSCEREEIGRGTLVNSEIVSTKLSASHLNDEVKA
jgi:hypothetical protein